MSRTSLDTPRHARPVDVTAVHPINYMDYELSVNARNVMRTVPLVTPTVT